MKKHTVTLDISNNLLEQALHQHQVGNVEHARNLYQQLLKCHPDHAEAIFLLGTLYLQGGQRELGLEMLARSLELNPAQPAAWNNQGSTLFELKCYNEAIHSFDQAILHAPGYAEAYYNRGNAFLASRQYQQAALDYEAAIRLNPSHALAYNNLGVVFYELRQYQVSLTCYARASTHGPDEAQFHSNRANAFFMLGRYNDAIGEYQQAIVMDSGFVEAYFGLAQVFSETRRYDLSAEMYLQLLQLSPEYDYALGSLIHACQHCCAWDELPALVSVVEDSVNNGRKASPPFPFLTFSASPQVQLKCARIWVEDKYPAQPPLWNGEIYRHERIRLAYVSADFFNHATAILMAELFELHDKKKFETFAVSLIPDAGDAMSHRLRQSFEHFIEVSAKSDEEIARLLREWEIDIVVDLKGHTRQSRFGVFAYRPVPVQVTYLGYPGTTGADYMDYVIADPVVIPVGQESFYSENVVRLSGCYQVNDRKREISDMVLPRHEYALPDQAFVFCCFNAHYKITPEVFAVWMRLLKRTPHAVLWLLEDNPVSVSNLRRYASEYGVEDSRLVFARRLGVAEHLARHRAADLFLDTFPTAAHTTASDALWAGLPMIAFAGQSFASRVSASLLQAMGLEELIVESLTEYEQLALSLATSMDRLVGLKSKLAYAIADSPVFNSSTFCHQLELAYLQMCEKSQAGLPAHEFSVLGT